MLRHVRISADSGKGVIVPWIDPHDKREEKETERRFIELTSEVVAYRWPISEVNEMLQRRFGI